MVSTMKVLHVCGLHDVSFYPNNESLCRRRNHRMCDNNVGNNTHLGDWLLRFFLLLVLMWWLGCRWNTKKSQSCIDHPNTISSTASFTACYCISFSLSTERISSQRELLTLQCLWCEYVFLSRFCNSCNIVTHCRTCWFELKSTVNEWWNWMQL